MLSQFRLIPVLFFVIAVLIMPVPAQAGPQKVEGAIYDIDHYYDKYGALGFVIIKWDADPTKGRDRMVLIVDKKTVIKDGKGKKLNFKDLKKGGKAQAKYVEGRDGLHATKMTVSP